MAEQERLDRRGPDPLPLELDREQADKLLERLWPLVDAALLAGGRDVLDRVVLSVYLQGMLDADDKIRKELTAAVAQLDPSIVDALSAALDKVA